MKTNTKTKALAASTLSLLALFAFTGFAPEQRVVDFTSLISDAHIETIEAELTEGEYAFIIQNSKDPAYEPAILTALETDDFLILHTYILEYNLHCITSFETGEHNCTEESVFDL